MRLCAQTTNLHTSHTKSENTQISTANPTALICFQSKKQKHRNFAQNDEQKKHSIGFIIFLFSWISLWYISNESGKMFGWNQLKQSRNQYLSVFFYKQMRLIEITRSVYVQHRHMTGNINKRRKGNAKA